MDISGYKNIRYSGASSLGIGIDLVEIERIRRLVERFGENFLKKVFSQREIIDSYRHANPYPSLGARLAAKEATAKALGIGIGSEFLWVSAIVALNGRGKPEIYLDDLGQRKIHELGVRNIELSLTHTQHLAQAIVILST